MLNLLRFLGAVVLLGLVALLAIIFLPVWKTAPTADLPADWTPVDGTGQYAMYASDCMACHTAPGGQPFAGGLAIASPMGTIWSTNITPDVETGIGGYTLDQFRAEIDDKLGCRSDVWSAGKPVRRVAVVGGAAADHWDKALAAGADTFVTGEVPHHISILAASSGLNIVAAGHFATENPGMKRFSERLAELVDTKVDFYEPEPGQAGRPI